MAEDMGRNPHSHPLGRGTAPEGVGRLKKVLVQSAQWLSVTVLSASPTGGGCSDAA